jgi:molecular chaperone DnaK
VEIHVLQGEREMARDNRTLGRFHLVGIPPAPRGMPQIEVAFDIDANGIVNVSAKDLGTGKEQKITITGSSTLTEDEVKRMVKEGEAHAEEDKKKKQEIEARNQLDSLVYTTEKTLNENRDKISEPDRKGVEDALSDAKKALESGDADKIKEAVDRLTKASHKMAEAMYRQAGAGKGAEPGKGEKPKDEENVVDTEFEEVKK